MRDVPDAFDGILAGLERLEAERKLRSIPAQVLETSWVLEAQVEAVIDALLRATTLGNVRLYAHARHTGEWAARIAAELPFAPSPAYMRRSGALAEADAGMLAQIREVKEYAPAVRAFQELRMTREIAAGGIEAVAARIIAVADEFDSLVFEADKERRYPPADALRMMLRTSDMESREIVAALRRACRNAPASLFQVA